MLIVGFINEFKEGGSDGALIQQLCEAVKERVCQLTEVQFSGGADEIKKFVYFCNPDKSKLDELERQQEKKKNRYKEVIYDECLRKVIRVLQENDVDKATIEKVRKIEP